MRGRQRGWEEGKGRRENNYNTGNEKRDITIDITDMKIMSGQNNNYFENLG